MTDWVLSIADCAEVPAELVHQVLTESRVVQSGALPRPRRLALRRLEFSGMKRLGDQEVPFAFEQDFQPGLLCLASYDNLVGKSSVLETIRWALRGRPSVQADVESWTRRVQLDAAVDGETFSIEFVHNQGDISGRICGTERTQPYVIADFASGTEFERKVSAFLLDRLGLETVPFWQKRAGDDEDGDVRSLGWPSLSGVLHVTDKPVLVGDEVMGGQPGRLLQVFLGTPWAPTLFAAKAALSAREQQVRMLKRRLRDEVRVRRDDGKIKADLERARVALAEVGGPEDLEEVDRAIATAKEAAAALTRRRERVEDLTRQSRQARRLAVQDERVVLDLRETRAAKRFFQGLDPQSCPRCDTAVDDVRRAREHERLACALCGTTVQEAQDDGATLMAEAEARFAASGRAREELETALSEAESALVTAEEHQREARLRVQRLTSAFGSERRRRELELSIARFEGMLAERAMVDDVLSADPADDRAIRILKCGVKEVEKRMKAEDGGLFDQLNTETAELARFFGMSSLERVEIERSARMKVVKGGETMWFSDVTPGERMRLKVAVVLAMLRIGRRTGVGRHPGLLLVDSPGSNEANAEDFADMLRALSTAAEELEIQVITTSARPDVVQACLPPDRLRIAKPGKTLW